MLYAISEATLRPIIVDMPVDDGVSAQTGLTFLGETLRMSFFGEALREPRRRASTWPSLLLGEALRLLRSRNGTEQKLAHQTLGRLHVVGLTSISLHVFLVVGR